MVNTGGAKSYRKRAASRKVRKVTLVGDSNAPASSALRQERSRVLSMKELHQAQQEGELRIRALMSGEGSFYCLHRIHPSAVLH